MKSKTDERLRFLESLVDAVEQAVIATDREGKVVFWSRGAGQIYGWSAQEALGRRFRDLLVSAASRERGEATCRRLRRGERWAGQLVVRRRDGAFVPIHLVASPILDDGGDIARVVSVATDLTERKPLESSLEQHQSRETIAAALAFEAIWECDLRADVLWWSGGAGFNYAPQEIAGAEAWWAERLHPNDRSCIVAAFRRAAETGAAEHSAEFRFRRHDDTYVWVRSRCHFRRDPAGRPLRALGVMTDLDKADVAGHRLRLFSDQLPVFAWAADTDFHVLWTIGSAFQAGGPPPAIGTHIGEVPGICASSLEAHRAALRGESARYESRFNDRLAQISVHPLRDDTGRIIGAVGAAVDVTERKRAEQALQERERELLEAQQVARIGRWEWDLHTGAICWSDELFRIFGMPRGFPMTRAAVLDLVHPEDRARQHRRAADAFEGTALYGQDEYRIIRPDGVERVLQSRGVVVRDDAGQPVRVVGTMMDITERARAEQELAQRLRQQAAVAQLGLAALGETDLTALFDRAVATINATLDAQCSRWTERLADGSLVLGAEIGGQLAEVGKHTLDEGAPSLCTYTLRSNEPVIVEDFARETRFAVPAGAEGSISAVSVPVRGREGPFGILSAYARSKRTYTHDDINFLQSVGNVLAMAIERDRASARLREQREQLRALSHRLIQAQEVERRSISRELHDDFGQLLTALHLNLQRERPPSENIPLVDDALQRMRDLARDLRPSILDDLGLCAALQWYVGREAPRAGLAFRFDIPAAAPRFAPVVETTCFRVVQEALTNVQRHAQARSVEVGLVATSAAVSVAVRDDGCGFDLRAARGRAVFGESQGLLVMEERISLAGGELHIESGPGAGTTVFFSVPLPEQSG